MMMKIPVKTTNVPYLTSNHFGFVKMNFRYILFYVPNWSDVKWYSIGYFFTNLEDLGNENHYLASILESLTIHRALLPHSAQSWILILRIWQVWACKMVPQSGIIFWPGPHPKPHPLIHPQLSFFFQCCVVSPPLIRYVQCPQPNKVRAVSPPQ